MAIIYTNSVPINIVYTNINHFFVMADFKPIEVYVNFWDNFALKHHVHIDSDSENKIKDVYETIDSYEKLISHCGIPCKKLIYSDASNRLLRDRIYYSIFEEISSKITTEDIMGGFELENLVYKDLTFANLFNIIIDYLIAVFIEDLYPNKKFIRPDIYLTSERFKVFYPIIEDILKKEFPGIRLPSPHYVSPPFILCPIERKIPANGMSKEEIMGILKNYYKDKEIINGEIEQLILIFGRILNDFYFRNTRIGIESFIKKMKVCEKQEIIDFMSRAFLDYYKEVGMIINKKRNEVSDSITIGDINSFEKKIKPLNNLKLKILSLCNGENSPYEISKILKLKNSTVSVYITQLRKNNMVTNEKNPRRLSDKIVLNFREMN